MTRDLLAACGRALHGEAWQSPLARDLGVALRTVQRWASGETERIPIGVGGDLRALLEARRREIARIVAAL